MPHRRLLAGPLALFITILLVCPLVAAVAAPSAAPAPGVDPAHPQTTLHPTTEVGHSQNSLFYDITAWEFGIFLIVEALLLIAIVRFRARPGRQARKDIHGHTLLEFGWTLAPAIVLGFIAVPTVRTIFRTQAPAAAGALQVTVIGHQWWWEFRYPELGVTTAGEMHLPLGRTASLQLESADVVHSFWVPSMGGKRDVIPNRVNYLWFTPSVAGVFPGQCAEFCGMSHANMRMRAVVESPEAFAAWARAEAAPPAPLPPGEATAGAAEFARGACIGCHTMQGVSAGVIGPNLTHVASRGILAGGVIENTPENMARWLADPPAVKPGSLMPKLNLTDAQIRSLVAYLEAMK